MIDSEFGDDFASLKTQLQSIHPFKAEICSENLDDAPDLPESQPRRVCVNDQILFFKTCHQL